MSWEKSTTFWLYWGSLWTIVGPNGTFTVSKVSVQWSVEPTLIQYDTENLKCLLGPVFQYLSCFLEFFV